MAHNCPDCSYTCHCGGDIDDMVMDGTKEEQHCTHCPDEDDGEYDCFDEEGVKNDLETF